MNTKLLILLAGGLLTLSVNANAQNCNGSIPKTTSHLVDNGNGTIKDPKTDLIWKRCSEGQTWNGSACTGSLLGYNWKAALEQAGGDWRLPNVKELASIVEQQCLNPSINLALFPNTNGGSFWTSSIVASQKHTAWNLNFGAGYFEFSGKNAHRHVRLVTDVTQ